MNQIPSINFLLKKLGIFIIVFLALTLASSTDIVKKGHNNFFCGFTNVIFNIMNPEVFARFSTETRTDLQHFGIAIELYDQRKKGRQRVTRSNHRMINPDVTKFPNLHALVIIPTIFIFSLFVVTPVPIKTKLIRAPLALFIFYICLVFYFSYIFSVTLNRGAFEIDSFWHLIIRPFGVDNVELINVWVILIWAGLAIPKMMQSKTVKKKRRPSKT